MKSVCTSVFQYGQDAGPKGNHYNGMETKWTPTPIRMQPQSRPASIIKPQPKSSLPSFRTPGNLGAYKHICEICKKAFADKRHLTDHLRKHEGRVYKCEFCPKSFSGYRGLELHTPIHTGKYPFHCSQCHAGFNYR